MSISFTGTIEGHYVSNFGDFTASQLQTFEQGGMVETEYGTVQEVNGQFTKNANGLGVSFTGNIEFNESSYETVPCKGIFS